MSIVSDRASRKTTKAEAGRLGGLASAKRYGGRAMTEAARASFLRRFERYADPQGEKSAYFRDMRLRQWLNNVNTPSQ